MVDEFIFFGGLDDTVEHHDPAEHGIIKNHQMLVFGFRFEVNLIDGEGLAVGVVKGF